MNENQSNDHSPRKLPEPAKALFWFIAFIDLVPLTIYAFARATNRIPSMQEWEMRESNHGPLYDTATGDWIGLFGLAQFLLLPTLFFLTILFSRYHRRNFDWTLYSLLLHFVGTLAFASFVFWTID